MTTLRALLRGSAAAAVLLASGMAYAADATPERLLNAGSAEEAGNWLTVHRTYDANRYSPLNEITPENVSGLKLAYMVPLGGNEPSGFGAGNMEGTPLAKDGFLYITDPWGTPYKIDATSGKRGQIVWICDTGVEKDPAAPILLANRGLALWNDLVIGVLSDGRVIACDDETGEIAWEQQTASEPGEGFSNAPLVVGDKVLVGQSFGDWATRGWVAALNAADGEEIWRFYTIPEPGQPGSETWKCEEASPPNADCWKTGGGAAWVTGSYDPETNITYWGTANPVPMFDPETRPGDNLYTNSTVALDADTGELKWFFQYTPGDYMDYDEVGIQLLADVEINGETRKVLAHFGRNGIFYTLDRSNGAFIDATQYVEKLNWTKGIDPKTGMPLEYDPSKSLQEYANGALRRGGAAVDTCPHIQGGINYWPSAYDPTTGIAYGAGFEGCSALTAETEVPEINPGQLFLGGGYALSGTLGGSVFGFDVKTGEQVGKAMRTYQNESGVLLTPGLVWTGEMDGTLVAFDSKTLEEKWSINLGTGFKAPPMTFAVNGKQYIAIAGGGGGANGHPELETQKPMQALFVFAL